MFVVFGPLKHLNQRTFEAAGITEVFSDMNKGDWFWGGDRKYFRGFSDWNLRRDECLGPILEPFCDHGGQLWVIIPGNPFL